MAAAGTKIDQVPVTEAYRPINPDNYLSLGKKMCIPQSVGKNHPVVALVTSILLQ